MTAPHEASSVPAPDDRAIRQKWLPTAEKAEAEFARWVSTNRLPGERLDQTRARYVEAKPKPDLARIASATVRRPGRPRPVWLRALSAADHEASDAIDRSAARIVKD